jgi:predicted Zn-dependent protease
LPDSVGVRLACAWNLREAGRFTEAEALLRDGLSRREDPRLWDGLARVYLEQDATAASALDAARRASTLAPTEEHRTTLVLALLRTGNREEALRVKESISDPELGQEIDEALRRK